MRGIRSAAARWIAGGIARFGLVVWLAASGCIQPEALAPVAGSKEFQAPLFLPVPGGRVNLAGGNLLIERVDLASDTLLGEFVVGAVYNSSRGDWIWSFDVRYDGFIFTDSTGAEHDIAQLSPGAAIPGTVWVKLDASRIKTKGGLVHAFDPATSRLSTVSWEGQPYPVLSHVVADLSGGDHVVSITQCRDSLGCRVVYDIAYDAQGCVARIDDRAGRTALFEHDSSCRTLVARDGLDVARGWAGRRYEYLFGKLSAVVNSEGERVQYSFLDGRLTRASAMAEQPSETLFRYGHNPLLGLYFTLVTDPTGAHSTLRYDAEGRLREYDDATGARTVVSWAGQRPSSRTDPMGITTTWEWHEDDLVRTTLPTGNVVSMEYASFGQDRSHPLFRPLLRISDSLGVVEERSYNAAGRVSAIFDGVGDRTNFAYDAEGNLIAVVRADSTWVAYSDFGDHGHPLELQTQGYLMHRVYDEVGNLLEGGGVHDPLASRRPGIGARSYDEDRNWVTLELSGGDEAEPFLTQWQQLRIDYRSDGQPLSISRPYGGDTSFGYDEHGRRVAQQDMVDGQWRVTRTEYDGRGLVTALERPNAMRMEIDYDPLGRPVETRLLRAGVVQKTLQSSWRGGRLESRRDSSYNDSERFSYDSAGRRISVDFPSGESIASEYDARSREVSRRYIDAAGLPLRTLEFAWDGSDRRIRIDDEGHTVLDTTLVAGHETTIRYGNGLVRELTYHAVSGLMKSSETTTVDGRIIEQTTTRWSLCDMGVLCIDANTWTADTPGGSVQTVSGEGYALGGFTPEELPPGQPGMRLRNWHPNFEPGFAHMGPSSQAYDVLGNRIAVASYGEIEVTFRYNSERNRLVSADLPQHRDYVWDEAGYLVRRDESEIIWDAGGRIIGVGSDTSFEWDVQGRLVRSSVGGSEYHTRFGGEMLTTLDGTPISLDLGDVKISLATGERLYRHYDFRGNVKWVSGDSGETLRHYAYGPWGVREAYGDHPDNVSFARGQQIGDLVLMGARMYDPETGRFISPDPLGHVINQYAYTQGNPALFWDPGGLRSVPAGSQSAGGSFVNSPEDLDVAGNAFIALGIALIGTGLATGNVPAVHFGSALYALGIGLRLRANTLRRLDSGRVTIIDLTPGQGNYMSGSSGQKSKIVVTSACAPVSRARSVGSLGMQSLAVLAQLGLGAGLTLLLRSRRRRAARDE